MARQQTKRKRKDKNEVEVVKTEWEPGPLWGIAGCILVVVLVMLWSRWADIKGTYLMSAASYQTTNGVIVSSSSFPCGKAGRSNCFEIIYKYSVEGKSYVGDHVNFRGSRSDYRDYTDGYVRKYPVGKSVVVYYEIGNPSFAVLEPDTKFDSMIVVYAALILAGVCAVSAVYLTAKREQEKFTDL